MFWWDALSVTKQVLFKPELEGECDQNLDLPSFPATTTSIQRKSVDEVAAPTSNFRLESKLNHESQEASNEQIKVFGG